MRRATGELFRSSGKFRGVRQSANAADDATNFVIGDDFAEARQPNEQLCERGVIARFAEISMTDEKAARNFKAIRVTGNDDARAVGLVLDNMAKEAKPVHVRHGQVGYNSVELTRMEQLSGLFATGRRDDLVLLVQCMREFLEH